MKHPVRGALWRMALFVVVSALSTLLLVAIFAQYRSGGLDTAYKAEFTNVTGLKKGDFVRIAGVEVGQVKGISIKPDGNALVTFTADRSVVLTEGNLAAVRYHNLFGDRYMSLEEGTGGVKKLSAGQTIPVERTRPALDLDALMGGFQPLFRALDADQVNGLTAELIKGLQGQGGTVGSFLDRAAALTGTLADRDLLIGSAIDKLNVLLGSLGDQSDQFDKAVTSAAQLVDRLAERKAAVTRGLARGGDAAGTIADLLQQTRAPIQQVVHETDRTALNVLDDAEYFNFTLYDLTDRYRALNRQAIYGDYFSFYFCDVVLKLNGKGGQPLYAKVINQDTGRCQPK